jgi:hypothetical protein
MLTATAVNRTCGVEASTKRGVCDRHHSQTIVLGCVFHGSVKQYRKRK